MCERAWHALCRSYHVHGEGIQQTQPTLEQIWQHVRQLERLVEQMTLVQARQIDRERSVPGSDPAELEAIDVDLAAVRGITHKLVELQHSNFSLT
jgi:hypothetical protein